MGSKIPTIDFSHFLTGSAQDRQRTACEVDNALKSVGFFYLVGHGIDQDTVDACFEMSKRIFDLSHDAKQTLSATPHSFDQGYRGIGKETIRGQKCVKESFDFRNPKDDTVGFWPNQEELPGFRDFAADFHQLCAELMGKLLECLSVALDLENEDSFNQYHTGSMHVSSLIHYPAVSTQRLRSGEVIRNAAHSDLGTLTLLFQHNVGGLEVADMSSTDKITTTAVEKEANFIAVDPTPGTIVVNVGYLLMRWTNGRWKNVVHRVVEPANCSSTQSSQESVDCDEMTPERYSIAFFGFPDAATMVEPLQSCCSTERPKRWGPINAGEYLLKKRAVLYS
ncbi:uncharacterized protein PV07_08770 [Cladophialophora immunda]|uniref:Fe2OG dioxygenase domain-containing protein n=1 Tax=Cladophialophora immunda TaxID=569365 RepID=A0A0D2CPV3_9EURO|nr:uncharacterized protein PV07_08770 [Cladophialophora immunda]KIW25604.1 hypothetical protein PV07_08770 [Cladophialophora immunda]OQV07706.1 hypothetical protein CLAIMM_12105 [Cladophialophora immunda]